VFATKSVPQAFAVVKDGLESDAMSALDEMAAQASPKAKSKAKAKPKTKPIPAYTISPTVLSSLPKSSQDDKTFTTALAALPEEDALDVIDYVKANAKKGFGPLLNHLIRNKGLKSLVVDIKEKKANERPPEADHFYRIYMYMSDETEEQLRKYADKEGLDADEMLRWFEIWKTQGK
jgi:hypothetical protein